MTDPDRTDLEPAPPTVLARLLAAGISEDRARGQLAEGVVLVDGEPVTDPDQPTPPLARIVIAGR